jgi:hypothetical protein
VHRFADQNAGRMAIAANTEGEFLLKSLAGRAAKSYLEVSTK